MRHYIALLILMAVGGCIGEKCSRTTENYTSTETAIDRIPIDVTTEGGMETYTVRKRVNVPLNYSIMGLGSSVVKTPLGNKSYRVFEYGRLDQRVTAKFFVVLKNTDDIGGNFTIVGKLTLDNKTRSRSETVFIGNNGKNRVNFEFNITRGQKWSYGIDIIPPRRIVIVSEVVEKQTDDTETFVEYDYLRRTIDVIKNRTVEVC